MTRRKDLLKARSMKLPRQFKAGFSGTAKSVGKIAIITDPWIDDGSTRSTIRARVKRLKKT